MNNRTDILDSRAALEVLRDTPGQLIETGVEADPAAELSGVYRYVGITTRQFPAHKDGVIGERWARALSEAGYRPAVATAGIHYDNLNREQIAEVTALTDHMLEELLHRQFVSPFENGG